MIIAQTEKNTDASGLLDQLKAELSAQFDDVSDNERAIVLDYVSHFAQSAGTNREREFWQTVEAKLLWKEIKAILNAPNAPSPMDLPPETLRRIFSEAIVEAEDDSILYHALWKHFCEELKKAHDKGMIATRARMKRLFPVIRDINEEIEEIENYFLDENEMIF